MTATVPSIVSPNVDRGIAELLDGIGTKEQSIFSRRMCIIGRAVHLFTHVQEEIWTPESP